MPEILSKPITKAKLNTLRELGQTTVEYFLIVALVCGLGGCLVGFRDEIGGAVTSGTAQVQQTFGGGDAEGEEGDGNDGGMLPGGSGGEDETPSLTTCPDCGVEYDYGHDCPMGDNDGDGVVNGEDDYCNYCDNGMLADFMNGGDYLIDNGFGASWEENGLTWVDCNGCDRLYWNSLSQEEIWYLYDGTTEDKDVTFCLTCGEALLSPNHDSNCPGA